ALIRIFLHDARGVINGEMPFLYAGMIKGGPDQPQAPRSQLCSEMSAYQLRGKALIGTKRGHGGSDRGKVSASPRCRRCSVTCFFHSVTLPPPPRPGAAPHPRFQSTVQPATSISTPNSPQPAGVHLAEGVRVEPEHFRPIGLVHNYRLPGPLRTVAARLAIGLPAVDLLHTPQKTVQPGVVQIHRIPRQGREQPPFLGQRLEPQKSETVDGSGPEEILDESPEFSCPVFPGHPMFVPVGLYQIQQISLEAPIAIGLDPLRQHGGGGAALQYLERGESQFPIDCQVLGPDEFGTQVMG